MKVGLITRHFIPNYGSVLQTYATVKVIENFGYDCTIINYIREDEEPQNVSIGLINQNDNWSGNSLKRYIYQIYQFFNCRLMYNIFYKKNKNFLKNKTTRIKTKNELLELNGIFDIFCSGSDQLWGPIGRDKYDENYFLSFVSNETKCISYAGSFGKNNICEELNSNLKKLFDKYSHISVREQSAVDILKSKKIDSMLVLDPTLLISKEEWIELVNINKEKNNDYIFVYQLHNNKDFDKYVEKIAKKMGLKVYIITTKLNNLIKKGKKKYLPSLDEFLSLLYNAKYVITDSFHGTVFSIIFNKKFISVTPGVTSTRIEGLLSLFQLDERYALDCLKLDSNLIDKEIDWTKVNIILNEKREESKKWLLNALKY